MTAPQKILIIDADRETRERLRDHLKSHGFGTNDGYAITEERQLMFGFKMIVAQKDFAAIITAWKNPLGGFGQTFDGLDLVRKLREHEDHRFHEVPVIVFTNASRDCMSEYGSPSGPNMDIIAKIQMDLVPGILRRLLGKVLV